MTANYVARETGYAMHGWGHGDTATHDAFRPIETYRERLDALLGQIRALGFDTVDLWGAHLGADWATDQHVAIAREVLAAHGLDVATYATWIGPSNVDRACDLAVALGTRLIGAGISGDPAVLAPTLRERGVTVAVENHPERTPAEMLETLGRGEGVLATTVDTGWWATQGYDPVRAIEELRDHVRHVHLKDVLAGGEHLTCRWGEGIVDVEGCVLALQAIGYAGTLTVEHEPEDADPSDACRDMLGDLRRWIG